MIAIAGVWFTFGDTIGDICLDIVGCFVIGNDTEGTTAGGDNDVLACCAELELDVSSLFRGDVGDWLCEEIIIQIFPLTYDVKLDKYIIIHISILLEMRQILHPKRRCLMMIFAGAVVAKVVFFSMSELTTQVPQVMQLMN